MRSLKVQEFEVSSIFSLKAKVQRNSNNQLESSIQTDSTNRTIEFNRLINLKTKFILVLNFS